MAPFGWLPVSSHETGSRYYDRLRKVLPDSRRSGSGSSPRVGPRQLPMGTYLDTQTCIHATLKP